MKQIADGVWPTMLTLFADDGRVDYNGLEKLIEWYIRAGVDGIFAMCQSSEMFYLSPEEKKEITAFVVKTVNGRVPVIASGHTSFDMAVQIREMKEIAQTGVDAVVFITNILAGEAKSEDAFRRNVTTLMEAIDADIPFGLYECPVPFKYVVPPSLLQWCAQTGRFAFLKDTCCDIDLIGQKLNALRGTGMKLYNANIATLLDSLRMGAAGFSGVMANFFPELFVWLERNYQAKPEQAEQLQDFLSVASLAEYLNYPVCAKHYLKPILGTGTYTRTPFATPFTKTHAGQMQHLRRMAERCKAELGL